MRFGYAVSSGAWQSWWFGWWTSFGSAPALSPRRFLYASEHSNRIRDLFSRICAKGWETRIGNYEYEQKEFERVETELGHWTRALRGWGDAVYDFPAFWRDVKDKEDYELGSALGRAVYSMAEGWAHHLKSDVIEPYSAGLETHGLNPNAVKVMQEAGVDISGQQSTHVKEYKEVVFDNVVTVCGHAHENCPVFIGSAKVIHVGFDDPPALARDAASEEEALSHYRRVRDEIKAYVITLPETLNQEIMEEA